MLNFWDKMLILTLAKISTYTVHVMITMNILFPTGEQAAFFAYMSKNIPIRTLSKHKALIYDRIETNAGNAYNSTTGKFTAPGDGMYVFHTTTQQICLQHRGC